MLNDDILFIAQWCGEDSPDWRAVTGGAKVAGSVLA